MKRLSLALLLLVLAVWPAHAQPVTVIGPVTPGDCALFNSVTILKDAGFNCSGSGGLPAIRTKLFSTTTFYVNADGAATHPCGAFTCQPGNNNNSGLTASAPWQTIQSSVAQMASNYDFAAQTVNLQAADGTYNECVNLPPYITTATVDKNVFILGNSGDVSKVVVTCASGNTFTSVNSPQGWVLKNITANGTNSCLTADYHSSIYWDGGAFGNCGNFGAGAENAGAFIEFVNHNYTITAGGAGHINIVDGGEVVWGAVTATISGSPTFTNGFIVTSNGGFFDDTNLTISGSFTGPHYNITGRPVVFSTGATASTSNSTQYIGLSSISNTENNYYTLTVPTNKIVGLVVNVVTPPGAGQTFTFTLRLGGGATLLTCTISGASASGCSDQIHATAAITANAVADLQVVSSAGAATSIMSASAVMQ
jgi:hypothetical protein